MNKFIELLKDTIAPIGLGILITFLVMTEWAREHPLSYFPPLNKKVDTLLQNDTAYVIKYQLDTKYYVEPKYDTDPR